ncbi:hypothetical protein TNCV_1860041 [Trichonephila clavipes]|nr:hypothetical protein TNCV_1860041 [Trichonephila clavipes]
MQTVLISGVPKKLCRVILVHHPRYCAFAALEYSKYASSRKSSIEVCGREIEMRRSQTPTGWNRAKSYCHLDGAESYDRRINLAPCHDE